MTMNADITPLSLPPPFPLSPPSPRAFFRCVVLLLILSPPNQEGIQLDCDSIPTCEMTCSGPNEELVRVLTMHAGCMTEWLFHAGWLKGVVTLVMFAFLNFSRVIIVGGIVKANWR